MQEAGSQQVRNREYIGHAAAEAAESAQHLHMYPDTGIIWSSRQPPRSPTTHTAALIELAKAGAFPHCTPEEVEQGASVTDAVMFREGKRCAGETAVLAALAKHIEHIPDDKSDRSFRLLAYDEVSGYHLNGMHHGERAFGLSERDENSASTTARVAERRYDYLTQRHRVAPSLGPSLESALTVGIHRRPYGGYIGVHAPSTR